MTSDCFWRILLAAPSPPVDEEAHILGIGRSSLVMFPFGKGIIFVALEIERSSLFRGTGFHLTGDELFSFPPPAASGCNPIERIFLHLFCWRQWSNPPSAVAFFGTNREDRIFGAISSVED